MSSPPPHLTGLAASAALLIACSSAVPPGAAATPTPASPANASAPADASAHHEHAHEHSHEHGAHGYHKDFSDAEGFAAHFDDPARDAWQHPEELMELMHIPPDSTVVDLGAGTGYFVGALSRRTGVHGKVLALDVEPKMIAFLERRVRERGLTNVEPRLVQADDPALAPASVARILIVNTWHHIDERPSYARKLAAALAPEGQIWIVDYTLESEDGPPPQHRLSPEQVTRELEQGGLHAEIVEPEPLPKQYIVRASR